MKTFQLVCLAGFISMTAPGPAPAQETSGVYFYIEHPPGEYQSLKVPVIFEGTPDAAEKAYTLFTMLCENECGYLSFAPADTKLLGVTMEGKKLVLDFSKEVESGGGNTGQHLFVAQLVNTAYSIPDIEGIIVKAEGELSYLAEGIDFTVYDKEGTE